MPHEMRGAVYRRVSPSGDSLGGPELHHQSAGGEVGGLGEGRGSRSAGHSALFSSKKPKQPLRGHHCLNGLLRITKSFIGSLKSSFGFIFCNILWKNPNELFGQSYTCGDIYMSSMYINCVLAQITSFLSHVTRKRVVFAKILFVISFFKSLPLLNCEIFYACK